MLSIEESMKQSGASGGREIHGSGTGAFWG